GGGVGGEGEKNSRSLGGRLASDEGARFDCAQLPSRSPSAPTSHTSSPRLSTTVLQQCTTQFVARIVLKSRHPTMRAGPLDNETGGSWRSGKRPQQPMLYPFCHECVMPSVDQVFVSIVVELIGGGLAGSLVTWGAQRLRLSRDLERRAVLPHKDDSRSDCRSYRAPILGRCASSIRRR